uniref:Uncharacterized protein n=1 Tax=Anguilla anguilla TaxID=7936 RepID=A0A0E9PAA3_ANGAN
MAHPVPLRL